MCVYIEKNAKPHNTLLFTNTYLYICVCIYVHADKDLYTTYTYINTPTSKLPIHTCT